MKEVMVPFEVRVEWVEDDSRSKHHVLDIIMNNGGDDKGGMSGIESSPQKQTVDRTDKSNARGREKHQNSTNTTTTTISNKPTTATTTISSKPTTITTTTSSSKPTTTPRTATISSTIITTSTTIYDTTARTPACGRRSID
ncbi:hypothetical protein BpHYR1_022838 [Brachionus plicatilis]|uniref:Uncharacterized protein n=1 Tax=Brachionus plicatilis TaxID=10195 RepID=A0A3M7P8T3_BRAPC|nr:hypothetical protein BpHYR1_022838 [Brachionus plicatilis]